MKKLLSFIIVSAAMISLASCGGGSKSRTSDTDTAVVAETAESEDAPALLETPDLTLLEVKGNVKEINGKTVGDYVYGKNARFDQEGRLTHYGNSDPIAKISEVKRDSEGRLTDFLASEWMSVKWDGEKPLSVQLSYNEETFTDTYKYDGALIVEVSEVYEDQIEETKTTSVGTITYPEDGFDAKGNWIKRIVKYPDHTKTQVREIIYY